MLWASCAIICAYPPCCTSHAGITDADIIRDHVTEEWICRFHADISSAKCVVLDGNLSLPVLSWICNLCIETKTPVFFEPTSVDRAAKIITSKSLHQVHCLKPNILELQALVDEAVEERLLPPEVSHADFSTQASALIALGGVNHVLLTQGASGVDCFSRWPVAHMVCESREVFGCRVYHSHIKSHPLAGRIVNTTGAGDSFFAGVVAGQALLQSPSAEFLDLSVEPLELGVMCASFTLQSALAVSPLLTRELAQEVLTSRQGAGCPCF